MSETRTGLRTQKPAVPLRPLPALIRASLLASAGALLCHGAIVRDVHAGPQGGTVVAGRGDIARPDSVTTVVEQRSRALAVNWKTFDVKAGELVRFNQPSASATVLNRVLNHSPSQIFGSVRANGQVFILNASGVVIGRNARVNVGGLFVSSLDISTDDFMAGNYQFQARAGETPGAIVNRGLIEAARGGSVSLLGGQVSNEGVIVADVGHVTLAAGRTATVDFDGDGLIRFEVDGDILDNPAGAKAAVSNSGTLQAEGGRVLLSAHTARQVFDRAVNNSGLIRAGSIQKTGGKVLLTGLGGGVRNTGTVDVSGTAGGEVHVTSDAAIEQLGTVAARGNEGNGGHLQLASLGTTTAGDGSVTSARSELGQGGSVVLLGSQVALHGTARVDVSGDMGGGTALVGGDYQGGGSAAKAARTKVSEHAAIDARARTDGDGGKVVVWADDIAEVRGSGNIDVRGGRVGGDGGFVETSGKHRLVIGAAVDASAANGQGGTWLLDPIDVTIENGGAGDVSSGGSFDTLTSIDAMTVVAALETGTSVEIRTDGTDNLSAGNITVVNGLGAIDMLSSTATLTLTADNDIRIQASSGGIQSINGTLNLALSADADGNNGGTPVNGETGGSVIVNDALSLSAGLLSATGVDVSLGTVVATTVNLQNDAGTTTVSGALTADTLTVEGGDVNLGTVTATTVNVQNVTGTATLSGVLTASALDVKASTLNAAFTGDGSSVIGAVNFLNMGTLTLGQAAGTQTYMGGVATDSVGGTVTLNGTVQTGGAAITLGAVELGSSVSLSTSGAGTGDININGAIDTASGAGTPAPLILDAGADDIRFAGAVGALSPLGAVTVDAAGDVSIDGSFSSAGFAQSAGTGTTSIGGQLALGGNLDVSSGAVNIAADVSTTGSQHYDAAVTLVGGARVLESSGDAPITFSSTLDGAFDLTTNTGAGTTFAGVVGGITPLASLTTDAGGDTVIAGGAVTTNGVQSYGDAVSVSAPATLSGSVLALPATGSISTAGNELTLTFDNVVLDGTVNAASGIVTFDTLTGRGVNLGTETAGELSFTAAEVAAIAANTLRIGAAGGAQDNAGITVSAAIAPAAATLALRSTGSVDDAGGTGTVSVAALGIESTGGPVTLQGTNDVDALAVSASGSVGFGDTDGFLVATVDGITGLAAANGAADATLEAGGDISQLAGATLLADALDVMITGGGNLDLTAAGNDMTTLNVDAAGSVSVIDGSDLGVAAGDEVTGVNVTLEAGGALSLAGDVQSAGIVNLLSGGDIDGGGSITAGDLTLVAGGGIGIGSAVAAATTGTLDLTSVASGAAGNIRFTDTSTGALATSRISTLSTNALTQQNIVLSASNGFDYDGNAAAAGLTGDTLVLGGNTTLSTTVSVPAGSVITLQGNTAVGAGGGTTAGAGTLIFDGNVHGNGKDLAIGTRVSQFTGNITMGAGDTLSLNSSATRFTAATNLIADNLELGGGLGSIDGPGSLTILRASSAPGDTIIGGADSQFSSTNIAALSGFDGTLGIGGTRTTPPSASQLLNDITVSDTLSTAGDVFVAGAGDVTFVSGSGKISTPGTVTVLALGNAVTPSSGNIFDTSSSLVGDPVIQADLIELAAAKKIGSELSSQGALLNVTANTISPIQSFEGEVQVRNTTFPEASSDSVLPVVEVYALAGSPGGPLEGLISPAFVDLLGADVGTVVTPRTLTVREEENDLAFIDEGIFLLPPTFTGPERAMLLPVLGDPDFPADQRPEDPNDDAAWLAFFEGVVLEFIRSRHPVSKDAGVEERTAVETVVAAELAVVVAYYDAVRERERGMLARG